MGVYTIQIDIEIVQTSIFNNVPMFWGQIGREFRMG